MKTGVLSLTVRTGSHVRVSNPARGIRVVQDREWEGFDFSVRLPRGADKDAINARAARLRKTGFGVTFHRGALGGHRVRLTGLAVRSAIHEILNQPGLGAVLLAGVLATAGRKGPEEICKPFKVMVNEVILG